MSDMMGPLGVTTWQYTCTHTWTGITL